MAYTNDDYRISVSGTMGLNEIWNHTWAVQDSASAAAPQDIASIIAAFYEDITGFASWLSNDFVATRCVVRRMGTGTPFEALFGPFTGASAASVLPNQLAMRVSLTAGQTRGGPFLNGFVVTACDTDGSIESACVTDFVGALETMVNSLQAADLVWAIDKPKTSSMTGVEQARVGTRFDVIRKRANNIQEAYIPVTL